MTGGNASAPAMAVAFSFGKQGGITMAIGQRIRFFRNRKGMTQKQLGEVLGFLGKILMSVWHNMNQKQEYLSMTS